MSRHDPLHWRAATRGYICRSLDAPPADEERANIESFPLAGDATEVTRWESLALCLLFYLPSFLSFVYSFVFLSLLSLLLSLSLSSSLSFPLYLPISFPTHSLQSPFYPYPSSSSVSFPSSFPLHPRFPFPFFSFPSSPLDILLYTIPFHPLPSPSISNINSFQRAKRRLTGSL